jgi:hypothetical protein
VKYSKSLSCAANQKVKVSENIDLIKIKYFKFYVCEKGNKLTAMEST